MSALYSDIWIKVLLKCVHFPMYYPKAKHLTLSNISDLNCPFVLLVNNYGFWTCYAYLGVMLLGLLRF